MPISGEYTWSETDASIELLIPLKGVSPKKVDVFTASTILKVSYAPYLIDLDLFNEINVDKCRAILKDGALKILLVKKDGQYEHWGQLCFEGTKEETKHRRHKALKDREGKVKQQMENVAAKKVEEERMVFRQHMELERTEQQRIDDVKAQEKRKAEDAMYKTFSEMKNASSGETPITTKSSQEQVCTKAESKISQSQADDRDKDLPPPRAAVRSTFRHTPRFFKTPARESAAKQEREFIIKNRASLSKNKLLNVDKIGDVDPMWLKSKGDEMKARGDYSSAINAYSGALEADECLVEVLASRAACYLQIRQADCCIQDCLGVLGMKDSMDTEKLVQLEKETRVRLGMAYSLTKNYDSARVQFEEARQLNKNDKTITDCINYLKVLSGASALKEEADRLFAEGSFNGAIDTYTKATQTDPLLLTALINRAACYLATKDFANCIKDSSDALDLLSRGRERLGRNILAALLFPDSRTKRKWTVSLLCRRAAARQLEQNLASSLKDLEQALKLSQRDSEIDSSGIEKDISVLKGKRIN